VTAELAGGLLLILACLAIVWGGAAEHGTVRNVGTKKRKPMKRNDPEKRKP